MQKIQITIAILATWLTLAPASFADFTIDPPHEAEPEEGACSAVPTRKSHDSGPQSNLTVDPNVPAPPLPEPNRNVDSYMSIDGSPTYVKGEDGRLRSSSQAAVELNNEAIRRMNEGRHDEARPMLEKARELMGEAPESPVVEETSMEKYNRNVINQNANTVFKYDANRYDKSADRPSVQDVIDSLEPSPESP